MSRLTAILESDPLFDGAAIARIVENDLGLVLPRTVTLVQKTNPLLKSRPAVGLEPILDRVRHQELVHVDGMQRVVSGTKHLRDVLDGGWFDEVRGIIYQWDAASIFRIPKHPAYMGYCDDTIAYAQ